MFLVYLALIIIESYVAPLYDNAIPPDVTGVFQSQSSKDAEESQVIWYQWLRNCLWTLAAGSKLILDSLKTNLVSVNQNGPI